MGQLLTLNDFHTSEKDGGSLDPRWYFTDMERNTSGGRWWITMKVEVDFPHRRGIHWDRFNERSYNDQPEQRQLRIDIRRFVERQCLGNAIVVVADMSYEYLHEIDKKYGGSWRRSNVSHGYYMFNFEEDTDATLFALKFNADEVTNRHPERLDIPEDQIAHAEREKWKGERSTW